MMSESELSPGLNRICPHNKSLQTSSSPSPIPSPISPIITITPPTSNHDSNTQNPKPYQSHDNPRFNQSTPKSNQTPLNSSLTTIPNKTLTSNSTLTSNLNNTSNQTITSNQTASNHSMRQALPNPNHNLLTQPTSTNNTSMNANQIVSSETTQKNYKTFAQSVRGLPSLEKNCALVIEHSYFKAIDYVREVAKFVGANNIVSISRIQPKVRVFLKSPELVHQICNTNPFIIVKGLRIRIRPLLVPYKKIMIYGARPWLHNTSIQQALLKAGIPVTEVVFNRLGLDDRKYSHILNETRYCFLEAGKQEVPLPEYLDIDDDEPHRIHLFYETDTEKPVNPSNNNHPNNGINLHRPIPKPSKPTVNSEIPMIQELDDPLPNEVNPILRKAQSSLVQPNVPVNHVIVDPSSSRTMEKEMESAVLVTQSSSTGENLDNILDISSPPFSPLSSSSPQGNNLAVPITNKTENETTLDLEPQVEAHKSEDTKKPKKKKKKKNKTLDLNLPTIEETITPLRRSKRNEINQ